MRWSRRPSSPPRLLREATHPQTRGGCGGRRGGGTPHTHRSSGWRPTAQHSAVPHTPAVTLAARRSPATAGSSGQGRWEPPRSAEEAPRDRTPHDPIRPLFPPPFSRRLGDARPSLSRPPNGCRGPGEAALPSFPQTPWGWQGACIGTPLEAGVGGKVSRAWPPRPQAAGVGTTEGEREKGGRERGRRELTDAHGAEQHPSGQLPHGEAATGSAASQPDSLRSWAPQRAGGFAQGAGRLAGSWGGRRGRSRVADWLQPLARGWVPRAPAFPPPPGRDGSRRPSRRWGPSRSARRLPAAACVAVGGGRRGPAGGELARFLPSPRRETETAPGNTSDKARLLFVFSNYGDR